MAFVELPTEGGETITINTQYLVLLIPGRVQPGLNEAATAGTWMHFTDGSRRFTTAHYQAVRGLASQ
jgi:hypothetical protein